MAMKRISVGPAYRLFVVVILVLMIVGCLLFALSAYLDIDAWWMNPFLGENSEQAAIARVIKNFSYGVIAVAAVLGFAGGILKTIKTPERSPAEKIVVVAAIVMFATIAGFRLAPEGSFVDIWQWSLQAAFYLLLLGGIIAVKPQEEAWGKGEVAALVFMGCVVVLLLGAQVFFLVNS
jgi:hypothetical protein